MTITGGSYLSHAGRAEREYEKRPGEHPIPESASPSFSLPPMPAARERTEQIYRFSRQLVASNSLATLLENTVRETADILRASSCRAVLLEADGSWVCHAVYPPLEDCLRDVAPEPALAGVIYRQAAFKRGPTLLRRGSSCWRTLENQVPGSNLSASLCLVPLRFDDVQLGVLVFSRNGKIGQAHFSDERLELAQYLADQAAAAIYRAGITARLQESQAESVQALSKTLEVRDDHTGGHSEKMTSLAERIAAACHCNDEEILRIRWAGMLHDIGKIGIPDAILRRPGPLSEQEWSIIRCHPDIGAEIVLNISNLGGVAELVRSHHERVDGSGYPRRLHGDQIPLGARILALADAYTAMTDGRSYRTPINHAEAVEEIKRCSGTHFDPKVVEAFMSLFQ